MKRLLILLVIGISCWGFIFSQKTYRAYASIIVNSSLFGKKISIDLNLGQKLASFHSYAIIDENGKDMKFNNVIDALNYLGNNGWILQQVYTTRWAPDDTESCHWILYKGITDDSQILDGIKVKNVNDKKVAPSSDANTTDEGAN